MHALWLVACGTFTKPLHCTPEAFRLKVVEEQFLQFCNIAMTNGVDNCAACVMRGEVIRYHYVQLVTRTNREASRRDLSKLVSRRRQCAHRLVVHQKLCEAKEARANI